MKNYLKLIRLAFVLGAFTLTLSFMSSDLLNEEKENATVESKTVFNHGTWTTNLSGSNEVPSVDTEAAGKAIVTYRKDGNFYYRIILRNIDNVVAAHLHLGMPGENGPVVVTLFSGDPTGNVNGNFVSGSFAADEYPGLLQAVNDGNVYVNVHSTDFPTGEVRGQL